MLSILDKCFHFSESERPQQKTTCVRAKFNVPLRQIQTTASKGSDELSTIDYMTELHSVVMQNLHSTEQLLETVEYKVSYGASDCVFPLSTLGEIGDFDRDLYKKSDRNKLTLC
ncbi:hypothetical protein FGIG_11031 [Fasciola gigantica]|uniref:Uncharacterized protein n=1 Tax=Fasciola gigantica TaxID=46835 RepID=A0A504YI50_FASGI|nr:hypothetical protein FGIG_11031 [Fasciola gigantica]